MQRVISQTVLLPAPAEELYRMYINATEHEAITGGPVIIGANPGDVFSAFAGALSGKMLATAAPSLIVQSWRSTDFQPKDMDSTVILSFTPTAGAGRIDLVHINVPDHDFEAVAAGWREFYWEPWRDYLARKQA